MTKIAFPPLVCTAFLLLSGLCQPLWAAQRPDLNGLIDVNNAGGLQYSVPLGFPSDPTGAQFAIQLRYSQGAGSGFMGSGWSWSGQSSMERCPKNLSQDGVVQSLAFDASDRFCLDGKRLILVGGVYGSNLSEYRLEQDANVKIVAYGSNPAAPAYFKVWSDNAVLEYGNTASAVTYRNAVASAWALSKASDAFDNSVTYQYSSLSAGHNLPSVVSYSKSGASSVESLVFAHEDRPDPHTSYRGGVQRNLAHRLKSVAHQKDGVEIGSFDFSYTTGTGGSSRLQNIKSCGLLKICDYQSVLGWAPENDLLDFQSSGAITSSGRNTRYNRYLSGDFDGDGRVDLVEVWINGVFGLTAWLGRDGGLTRGWVTSIDNSNAYTDYTQFFAADVNGDGKADVIAVNLRDKYYATAWLSNGSSFYSTGSTKLTGAHQMAEYRVADVNGDGKFELIEIVLSAGDVNAISWAFDGVNFNSIATSYMGGCCGRKYVPLDMNGDGRTDFVSIFNFNSTTRVSTWLANGAGFTLRQTVDIGGWSSDHLHFASDVNVDGNQDLIHIWRDGGAARATTWMSKGNGEFTSVSTSYVGAWVDRKFAAGDVNGDGRSDILEIWNAGGGQAKATSWLSNGAAFVQGSTSPVGGWNSDRIYYLQDVRGLGRADLIELAAQTSGNFAVWASPLSATGNLVSIDTNGLGVRFDYQSILSGIYQPAVTPPPFPLIDAGMPRFVLAEMKHYSGATQLSKKQYRYGEGQKEVGTRRGFLGFRWMQSRDDATGLVSRTVYRQDWPFTGQVLQSGTGNNEIAWWNLGFTSYEYGCTDFVSESGCSVQAGRRYRVHPKLMENIGNRDVSASGQIGAGLPGKRISQEVDAWGNPTKITEEILKADGAASNFKKVTTHNYAPPDTNKWVIGRVLKSTGMSTTEAVGEAATTVLPTNSGGTWTPPPGPGTPSTPSPAAKWLPAILTLLLND